MTDNPESLLFPNAILPRSRDTIAQYEFLTSRLGAADYASKLLTLHQRSLASDAELASLLRSPEALDDVHTAAGRYAAAGERETIASAQQRAGRAARDNYKRAIAEQLAGADGHELQGAARAYLEQQASRDRAAAVERERAEQQRAAAERAAAEKRAAEQAERERLASAAEQACRRARGLADRRANELEATRRALAATVAERIRHHKLSTLRIGGGLYAAEGIVGDEHSELGIGAGHSLEFLLDASAAIDRIEADKREAESP